MWPISHRPCCSLCHISLECSNSKSNAQTHFKLEVLPLYLISNPNHFLQSLSNLLTHVLHKAVLDIVYCFIQLSDYGPLLQYSASYLLGSWARFFLCHCCLLNCYVKLRYIASLGITEKSEQLWQIIFSWNDTLFPQMATLSLYAYFYKVIDLVFYCCVIVYEKFSDLTILTCYPSFYW